MASPAIGRLEPVSIRELWKHEERGFSAWLESNLDVLSEAIGITLCDPQREMLAGNFQVDLVAEDENGDRVIIENQLEATDHDHLGKVITYLTNLEANAAIWISTAARPEHIRAVQWLNETTADNISCYLVQLAAYRISGRDPAAPLFTVIAGPSADAKSFGKQKKELAERHILRLSFWKQLLQRAKEQGVQVHAQRSPSKEPWISAGAGISGVNFSYYVWSSEEAAVELYIDTGDKDDNKRIFDGLYQKKKEIEHTFEKSLLWERLDEKRACRVRYIVKEGGLRDEDKWPTMQAALIAAMDKLHKAIKPHITRQ